MTSEDPLRRVEELVALITQAHATNYNRHRLLVDAGRDDTDTRQVLTDSARIAVHTPPVTARRVRVVALDQGLAKLLGAADPAADVAVDAAIVSVILAVRAHTVSGQQIERLDTVVDQIQDEREANTLIACQAHNARNRATTRALGIEVQAMRPADQDIADDTRKLAGALIDALVPVRNCQADTARQVRDDRP